MRPVILALLGAACILAAQPDLKRAEELYARTDYMGVLNVLGNNQGASADELALRGQSYFMLGDFKKASDALQKAVSLNPKNSAYALWLGRAYGRRAETSTAFTAPLYASKARQNFELAVELDGSNKEAINDLFDYYLQAPGFLGGGLDKASELTKRMEPLDAAEYHFALAQLAEKRKEFNSAEMHLRRAMELAPRQVGRILDLAKYLAHQGRVQESEELFAHAQRIAPDSPKVLFVHARTLIATNRDLDQARALLKKYLQSNLTPEDPSREDAEKLLKQTGA